MHFKRRIFPLGVSATCNHSKHREQRHLVANYFGVSSALNIKQIKKYYEMLTIYECIEK